MDKQSNLKNVVVFFIILVFCLLSLLLYYLIKLKNENNNIYPRLSFTIAEDEKKETIPEVLEKYECKYLEEDNKNIYVRFPKDLYDENGKSNEDYFSKIVQDLEKFFERTDFWLVDEKLNIKIFAKYDKELEKHVMIINNIKDYYENTDGKTYVGVNEIKYAKKISKFNTSNSLFIKLKDAGMKLNVIEEDLGEGIDLGNGYTSYLDGNVKLRKVNRNIVRNIVIDRKYNKKIFSDFNNDATLEEIIEKKPDYCFGSLKEGFLGYRTNEVYYFIYDDEVSMYGYSYVNNYNFEKNLVTYLNDGDFEKFINTLIAQMPTYDYCEYNLEEKSANIMYSSYGLEINIQNNNPKGITLYSNYCFTDKTKQFVKDGLVHFNNEENSIEKMEIRRRVQS